MFEGWVNELDCSNRKYNCWTSWGSPAAADYPGPDNQYWSIFIKHFTTHTYFLDLILMKKQTSQLLQMIQTLDHWNTVALQPDTLESSVLLQILYLRYTLKCDKNSFLKFLFLITRPWNVDRELCWTWVSCTAHSSCSGLSASQLISCLDQTFFSWTQDNPQLGSGLFSSPLCMATLALVLSWSSCQPWLIILDDC